MFIMEGFMEVVSGKNKENGLQVPASHYDFLKYMHKRRWCSLYHQIAEVVLSTPTSVLEVGVGNGFLGLILTQTGLFYESLDIDPELHPTYVGSVLEIPFKDSCYDTVVCCQVLEHLPYELFENALSELFRVAKNTLIISLPDVGVVYPFHVHRFFEKKLIPRPFVKRRHKFDGEHYWELNKQNFGLKKVKMNMDRIAKKYGFVLEKHYRVWEHPYHHYFIFKS